MFKHFEAGTIRSPTFYVLVDDLIYKLMDKFRIYKAPHEEDKQLKIFERELSVSLQDVFYREVATEGTTQFSILTICYGTIYIILHPLSNCAIAFCW